MAACSSKNLLSLKDSDKSQLPSFLEVVAPAHGFLVILSSSFYFPDENKALLGILLQGRQIFIRRVNCFLVVVDDDNLTF